MMRKLISLILFILLILSLASAVFAANFSGYSSWAYAELTEAEEYGLITDNIRVEMSAPITREEFAELAVRLLAVRGLLSAEWSYGTAAILFPAIRFI